VLASSTALSEWLLASRRISRHAFTIVDSNALDSFEDKVSFLSLGSRDTDTPRVEEERECSFDLVLDKEGLD
jgi:hypothetical protein